MEESKIKERAELTKNTWARMTEEERAERKAAIAEGMRRRWAKRTVEERRAIGRAIINAKREKASVD